jgi:hypothetical protein
MKAQLIIQLALHHRPPKDRPQPILQIRQHDDTAFRFPLSADRFPLSALRLRALCVPSCPLCSAFDLVFAFAFS